MAQHDYVIANGTGAAVRSDLNNALAAIVSQNSGATEPATTYAFQFWADTTTNLLKLRNSANNAWVTLFQLDGEWSTLPVENGTAAAPSIYFKDSGTDTGFYSPGTDQVAISTGGTGRLFINSSGSVGIGTSSPSRNLTVSNTAANPFISIEGSNTSSPGLLFGDTDNNAIGQIRYDHSADKMQFSVNGAERAVIDSSGRVGIGTTSAQAVLHAKAGNVTSAAQFETASNSGAFISFADNVSSSFTDVQVGCVGTSYVMRTGAAERARIDSSGRLLVGTSSDLSNYDVQIANANGDGFLSMLSYSSTASNGVYVTLNHSKSGTLGTHGLVSSGDMLGTFRFRGSDGSSFLDSAAITAEVDGTPGANDMPGRLVFSTTADGASSPTERMRLASNGDLTCPGVYSNTTAAAANVVVSTSPYYILRSTSSIKYKTNVEDIDPAYSAKLLDCRPVWFRSTCSIDNPNWSHWGFIAEEVASIDPRLVHWKTKDRITQEDGTQVEIELETPEPEGVQYDRFVPHLLNLIKRQGEAIAELQSEIAALKAQ